MTTIWNRQNSLPSKELPRAPPKREHCLSQFLLSPAVRASGPVCQQFPCSDTSVPGSTGCHQIKMDMEGPSPTSYIPCAHTSQVCRHMDLLKMQLGRGKIIAFISELLKIFLKFRNWNILFSHKNAKCLSNSKSNSLHTLLFYSSCYTMDIQWITNERQFRKHNPPSFLDVVLKIQQHPGVSVRPPPFPKLQDCWLKGSPGLPSPSRSPSAGHLHTVQIPLQGCLWTLSQQKSV